MASPKSIPAARVAACAVCGRAVWKSRTSAEVQRCQDCRTNSHGVSRYGRGCRCEVCTAAKTEYERGFRARRVADGRPVHKTIGPAAICDHCAQPFRGRAGRKFCSQVCAIRAQGGELGSGKSDDRPRRYMSDADRLAFFEAAGWLCALCVGPMLADAHWLDDFYPTLDHIVPRSRGGSDDLSNLQPAHRICNLRKGARHD